MSKSARIKSALDLLATVAVIAAAGLFFWRQFSPAAPAQNLAAAVTDVKNERIPQDMVTNVIGKGDIALVEFADYQCPYCARHAKETYPEIKKKLIDRGVIRYVFINYPITEIHSLAFKASEAAECAAAQNKFWEMHERLFDNPQALAESNLIAHGEALGLDSGAFRKCLSGEKAERVLASMQEGKRHKVDGTPAFFLGRVARDGSIDLVKKITGAVPYATFEEAVENVREQKIASR